MSELTASSMHDAQDAEDRRLLAAGHYSALVEGYYDVIIKRCTLKTRDREAGVDVAAEVVVRLLQELKGGKTYPVPFRVVVHKVIDWKVLEHFQARAAGQEVPLEDWDMPVDGGQLDVDDRGSFEWLLEGLTELERKVVTLRFWLGRTPEQVAAELGTTRNAVDQRLHHAVKKIRARLQDEGA